MKLSRIRLRRLIESVVNEKSQDGLAQNSEIKAAVQTRLNRHNEDKIEFSYQQKESKEDSRGKNYVYLNNKSAKGKTLVDEILDCLAENEAQVKGKSEASFTVNNFAGMNGLKFKVFGEKLTIVIPAKK